MGDIPAPTALYPAAPQQQPSALLSDPARFLGVIQQLNQIQQFRAKQSVGQAAQEAIGADGNIDPMAFTSGIKKRPEAALGAPEGVQSALEMQQRQIANGTGLFQQKAAQSDFVMGRLAGLAGKGAVSDEDLNNFAVESARNTGIPSPIINGYIGHLRGMSPKARADAIRTYQNTAAGPGAGMQRVQGPPSAEGAPTQVPLSTANQGLPAGGAGVRGGFATSLPPGEAEALAANQAEFAGDQTKAANTLSNVRPLQQALPLIQQLSHWNFGPGSPDIAKAKGLLTTLGITGVEPTDQLAVRQEVSKYLLRYAKGAQDAGRSDNALSAAIGSNPNLDLTQPANLSLVKNQIAMDRQDAALPLAAPADRQQYKTFKSGYYQKTDPRAFAFDLMSPSERADLKKSLGDPKSAAYRKFIESYNLAKQAGMLSAPGQ